MLNSKTYIYGYLFFVMSSALVVSCSSSKKSTTSTPKASASAMVGTISLSPNATVAMADDVTVTVDDATTNQPASQVLVTLSASDNNIVISPISGYSDASGQFMSQIISNTAETAIITATFGNYSASQNVTFIAGSPNVANCSINVTPSVAVADGKTPAVVEVGVFDSYNNPVPNQNVTLQNMSHKNVLFQGTTDMNGYYSANFTSSTAEIDTIVATFGDNTLDTNVTFYNATLSATPNTAIPADGISTSTLKLTISEPQISNSGIAVTWSSPNPNVVVPSTSTKTSADGSTSIPVVSTHAGAYTLSATFFSTLLNTNVVSRTTVTFTNITQRSMLGTQSFFTSNMNTVYSNVTNNGSLTIKLFDSAGNPFPNEPISIYYAEYTDPSTKDMANPIYIANNGTLIGQGSSFTEPVVNSTLLKNVITDSNGMSTISFTRAANPNRGVRVFTAKFGTDNSVTLQQAIYFENNLMVTSNFTPSTSPGNGGDMTLTLTLKYPSTKNPKSNYKVSASFVGSPGYPVTTSPNCTPALNQGAYTCNIPSFHISGLSKQTVILTIGEQAAPNPQVVQVPVTLP